MARLRHPNLAEVYDFGSVEGDGRHFLTMEFVTGEDLAWLPPGRSRKLRRNGGVDHDVLGLDVVVQRARASGCSRAPEGTASARLSMRRKAPGGGGGEIPRPSRTPLVRKCRPSPSTLPKS